LKQACDLHRYHVDDEDHERGEHHGGIGRFADSFCPFVGVVPLEASDQPDGETEEERLDERRDKILVLETLKYL
jgi:hypothetical protein